MTIIVSDDFHNEEDEIGIKRTPDAVYIDVPKKRNATMLVKILKIVLIYIINK